MTFKPNINLIVEIPISHILIDDAWNTRSGKWTLDSGDEETQEFSDLQKSIEAKGQITPVEVCLTGNEDKPYRLVKGYRRTRALIKLKNPYVRAIVRDLTETQAREENLLENVTRQNLTTPDFAWGLWELKMASKKEGKELSDAAIAVRLGRNQSYVGKLLTIMRDVKPEVTQRWRTTPKNVSVLAMLAIAKLQKSEQEQAFSDLLGDVETKESTEVPKQGTGWLEGAKHRAQDFGLILGRLVREELIVMSGLIFESHLDLCMKVNPTASAKQRMAIATSMSKGYRIGMRHKDAELDGEDEE